MNRTEKPARDVIRRTDSVITLQNQHRVELNGPLCLFGDLWAAFALVVIALGRTNEAKEPA